MEVKQELKQGNKSDREQSTELTTLSFFFVQLAEHEDLILRVSQMKNELVWQTTRLQQHRDDLHGRSKSHREQSN